MNAYDIVLRVLTLLGGLGAFLIGLKMMGDGLENISADKLRLLFNKISGNRFSGLAVGTGVTAIIQSSSATTVMVVGFVNAGVMTLAQATSIIMGANIGTTVTAQIMQLQGLGVTTWFMVFAAVGAFMMMSKKPFPKLLGGIFAGLGLIFVGLDVMSGAMQFLATDPAISTFFQNSSNYSPLLLFLVGLALTAVIQSSSATTSILIALIGISDANGLPIMTFRSAVFVILGINIGTCVTALLASIGTNTNAKRAALIHIMFNCFGALIFLPICWATQLPEAVSSLFPNNPQTSVAMFHTFFNVIVTFILIWFVKPIVKLSELIIPGKKAAPQTETAAVAQNRLKFIDARLLGTPAIALSQTTKEIVFMASLAKKNLKSSIDMVTTLNTEKLNTFREREKHIDFLNKEISNYLVRLSSEDIGMKNEQIVGAYYRVVSHIERIGDYAENVTEYAEKFIETGISFSPEAAEELKGMCANIEIVFENAMRVFETQDLAYLPNVYKYENIVNQNEFDLSNRHFERLKTGVCGVESGVMFQLLISNLERISDHLTNIANSVKAYAKQPVEVPARLRQS